MGVPVALKVPQCDFKPNVFGDFPILPKNAC